MGPGYVKHTPALWPALLACRPTPATPAPLPTSASGEPAPTPAPTPTVAVAPVTLSAALPGVALESRLGPVAR